MINVIRLTVYPPVYLLLFSCSHHLLTSFYSLPLLPFPPPLSLFCLVSFDLSSCLQVRPSQRATVWRSSVSPAPSAPDSCGWKCPAPTPTTLSAFATTTITSTPCQASARHVRCARQVRACTRTANTITTRCVRSVRTIPTLTERAPSTPACPAPSVKTTSRRWLLSARRPVTLSATVSPPHAQVAITPSLQVTWSGSKEKRYIRVLALVRFVSDQLPTNKELRLDR